VSWSLPSSTVIYHLGVVCQCCCHIITAVKLFNWRKFIVKASHSTSLFVRLCIIDLEVLCELHSIQAVNQQRFIDFRGGFQGRRVHRSFQSY
jgi:disulfide oxidoreductase YuzD